MVGDVEGVEVGVGEEEVALVVVVDPLCGGELDPCERVSIEWR